MFFWIVSAKIPVAKVGTFLQTKKKKTLILVKVEVFCRKSDTNKPRTMFLNYFCIVKRRSLICWERNRITGIIL